MQNQDKTIKVLRKREVLKNDMALGIAGELTNIEDKVDTITETLDNITEVLNQPEVEKPEVQKVSLEGISVITLKGDKGDKPTDEELLDIIKPLIPEVEDGKDYILTEQDKKDIAKSIKVPVVEKIIEKVEVIKEQPIVTNEIKEVAITDTAEQIVDKINSLETDDDNLKIDASHIKNLPEIVENFSQGSGLRNVFHDSTLEGTGTSAEPLRVVGGSGTGITRSISSVSTTTTAGSTAGTDYVYFVSGTTTINLPTAVGNTNRYTFVHTDTNTMTLATTLSQTIAFYPAAPATTATVTVRGTVVELLSDGTNWWTI